MQRKLEPRVLREIFLGYLDGVIGYKLWIPCLKKSIVSRDVVFKEDLMGSKSDKEISLDSRAEIEKGRVEIEIETQEKDPEINDEVAAPIEEIIEDEVPESSTSRIQEQAQGNYQLTRDRERRETVPSTSKVWLY